MRLNLLLVFLAGGWRTAGAVEDTLRITQASGLLDKAMAALECNVCKTSQLSGTVDDCCVDYTTVDTATKSAFLPLLTKLQQRNFFKYFKVDLEKECPFWEEEGQCMMRDCSVCECSPDEIPKPWLEEDERSAGQGEGDVQPGDDCSEQIRKEKACQDNSLTEKQFGKVDHSQSSPGEDLFNPWSEAADSAVWTLQDEGGDGFTYVNLDLNPEKFTGYSGASAARVWGSIYWENLRGFQHSKCMENRILFRLLSGLHSSIMTQIANEYRFDGGTWGPNTKMFVNAVGMHPDRLTNMYFAYVFVLRAIGKARPFLMAYEYDTGNAEDDALTQTLINELTNAEHGEGTKLGELPGALRDIAVPMCLRGFDENSLFGGIEGGSGSSMEASADGEVVDGMVLKDEFMHKFHNISRIMDCVGCEKCKLWGKLETLGLGTAIKIMFFSGDEEGKRELNALSRNELIALVNTAAQLAKSVGSVPGWRWLEVEQEGKDVATRVASWITALAAIVVASRFLMGRFSKRRGVNSEVVRDGVNGRGDGPGSASGPSAVGGESTEKKVSGETETETESESRGSSNDAAGSMRLKKGA